MKNATANTTANTTAKTIVGCFGWSLLWAMLVYPALARNPDTKAGMNVFWKKDCIRCHVVLGEGGRVGPDLSRAPSTASGLDLAAAMWSHAPQMWQRMSQEHLTFPSFQPGEMEDLFAFLAMARSFDEPGNAAVGQQLFQSKHCIECHSIRGEGGKRGPDLTTVAPQLNPVAWVAAMWNHAPGMFRALAERSVAFPRFQGSEMVDLQAFIRLKSGVASATHTYLRPPSAERGAALFTTKQCVRCHTVNGQGGGIGPDLASVALPRRYGEIAMVMWNHAPQMNRLSAAQSVPYPSFEKQELADVLAYLGSLSMRWTGDPKAGAATFAAKGCPACHSVTPGEKSVGPNLTSLQSELTPVGIARTMWNHGPAMLRRMESSSIIWPQFNSRDLANTLAFLKSIQKAPSVAVPTSATPTSTPGGAK